MKIIEQSHNVWGECPTSIEEAILWIERAGRVCYRSEDKIVEGSGEVFVNNIIKRKHLTVIEASNFVIASSHTGLNFSKYITEGKGEGKYFYGGNFRAWMEAFGLETLEELFNYFKYLPDYTVIENERDIPYELKRVTVEFITDRAVTHEKVRHRPCSFLQESQRYVSYKDQVEFIKQWYPFTFLDKLYLRLTEWLYKRDINKGRRPEIARFRLPNCTATKIIVTADLPEWKLMFGLRCPKTAYPQMRNIMNPVREEFERRGWA